jgi:hypothetical protein
LLISKNHSKNANLSFLLHKLNQVKLFQSFFNKSF